MSELTDKEMESLIYEHTRFNINQADDVETVGFIKNLLRAFSKQKDERIEELENICASAYQVVGVLLSDAGRFDDDDGSRVLDMLSSTKFDESVLPFDSKETVVGGK